MFQTDAATTVFDEEPGEVIIDPATHVDPGQIKIEYGWTYDDPKAAAANVEALYKRIRYAERRDARDKRDYERKLASGEPNAESPRKRIQNFEEGEVAFLNFPRDNSDGTGVGNAASYIMAFYNIEDKGFCARPHVHPYGERMVYIHTGPDSTVTVRSLSPIKLDDDVVDSLGWEKDERGEKDQDMFVIPPNSVYTVRIPRNVSHQFIPQGGNSAAISVHPAELDELQQMGRESNMAAQTHWLRQTQETVEECVGSGRNILHRAVAGNPLRRLVDGSETLRSRIASQIRSWRLRTESVAVPAAGIAI